MTDEEKKAIEDLKEVVELYNDKCLITTEDDFKSIEILLNLIEKQSKEIEELKGKNNALEIKANELYNLADVVKRDYIHKDKIKAKIEELKDEFKEYENGQEWEIQDEIRGQIEVLQPLLEKE